jgi:hypothetical protein
LINDFHGFVQISFASISQGKIIVAFVVQIGVLAPQDRRWILSPAIFSILLKFQCRKDYSAA